MKRRSFLKGIMVATAAVMITLQLTDFGNEEATYERRFKTMIYGTPLMFVPDRPVMLLNFVTPIPQEKLDAFRKAWGELNQKDNAWRTPVMGSAFIVAPWWKRLFKWRPRSRKTKKVSWLNAPDVPNKAEIRAYVLGS